MYKGVWFLHKRERLTEWVDSSWGKKKGRERPKIKLVKVVKKDMSIMEVTKSMVLDIIEWRKRIYVVDHC